MKGTKKAVAVKYPEGAEAPIILAKGEGFVAEKILAQAQANGILIKEDTTLVELLALGETGGIVPESAWLALAQIFAFILGRGEKK